MTQKAMFLMTKQKFIHSHSIKTLTGYAEKNI